jgi:hypothetical protein
LNSKVVGHRDTGTFVQDHDATEEQGVLYHKHEVAQLVSKAVLHCLRSISLKNGQVFVNWQAHFAHAQLFVAATKVEDAEWCAKASLWSARIRVL